MSRWTQGWRGGLLGLAWSLASIAAFGSPAEPSSVNILLRRAAGLAQSQQTDEARRLLEQAWRATTTDDQRARVRLAQGDLLRDHQPLAPGAGKAAAGSGEEPGRRARPERQGSLQAGGQSLARAAASRSDVGGAEAEAAPSPAVSADAYEQAIELAREDPATRTIAVNNLAVLWMESQRWSAAVELLERYQEAVPSEAGPLYSYNYGLALEGAGRLPEAFAAFVGTAHEQPDFVDAYAGVLRLTGDWLLPDSAQLAVELVRVARQAGYLEQAETLLESFLQQASWFDLPIYSDGLLAESLWILSSERPTAAGLDRWRPLLEDLEGRLPDGPSAKVEAIGQALAASDPARTDDPWAAWRWPPQERKLFSAFLKRLGDRDLRQQRWSAALDRYAAAWDVDVVNLDAATYLLNVLAIGPAELDPEGELASAALVGLQLPEFTAPAAEVAGTLELAGEALARHQRLDEAIEAWQLALEVSEPGSSMHEELPVRIAAAERDLESSEIESRPSPTEERRFREWRPVPDQARLGLSKTVAVVDFENRAADPWDELGGQLAEILRRELTMGERIRVVERSSVADILAEQELSGSAERVAALGSRTGAEVVVQGTITHVVEPSDPRGGLSFKGLRIGGSKEPTTVTAHVRLIDAASGQVLFARSAEGKSPERKSLTIRRRGSSVQGERSDSIARAAEQVIEEILPSLLEAMDRVPWQGEVIRVSGDQVIVNAGFDQGISKGLELRIFERGAEIIDPSSNESLGRLDEEIGRLRIERVEGKFSIGRLVSGQGVAAGNIVRFEPH